MGLELADALDWATMGVQGRIVCLGAEAGSMDCAHAAAHMSADTLRQRLAGALSLPHLMMGDDRPVPVERKPAAVLVGLVRRANGWWVVLTQRSSHMPTHPGQIALPGGKQHPEDVDSAATALREAQEEVGIDPRHARVLGTLSPYVTVTGFEVTPVVATLSDAPLKADPREVADLFHVPLSYVLNPANHLMYERVEGERKRRWYAIPYHDGQRIRPIWGATAGILRNLSLILCDHTQR